MLFLLRQTFGQMTLWTGIKISPRNAGYNQRCSCIKHFQMIALGFKEQKENIKRTEAPSQVQTSPYKPQNLVRESLERDFSWTLDSTLYFFWIWTWICGEIHKECSISEKQDSEVVKMILGWKNFIFAWRLRPRHIIFYQSWLCLNIKFWRLNSS